MLHRNVQGTTYSPELNERVVFSSFFLRKTREYMTPLMAMTKPTNKTTSRTPIDMLPSASFSVLSSVMVYCLFILMLLHRGHSKSRSRDTCQLNFGGLFSTTMAGVSDGGFIRVASFSDLTKQQKICVKVQDRNIALFLAKGSVYALDLFCYRKKQSNVYLQECVERTLHIL